MMKTVILICALGINRPDCSPDTATIMVQGPDATGLASCGFVGQAYLADTSFAEYLQDDHYLKIFCTSGDRQQAHQGPSTNQRDLAQSTDTALR